MGAKTWQHVVVQAPVRVAAKLVPEEVAAGQTRMRIGDGSTAEGAFWGKDTRRMPAWWTSGRWSGSGYVELRPHSSTTSELVVHLQAPDGVAARLRWNEARLARQARGLALALRYELDARAAAAQRPAEAARRKVARLA